MNNFNALLKEKEKAEAEGDFLKVTALTPNLMFNGGGIYNHTFFWESLCPATESKEIIGDLRNWIDQSWGSLDKFKADFNAQTAAIQGSGWGWLVYDKNTKSLGYKATPN